MSPNTRPPLTSRIRASFDGGKRTKSEVTSPTTNGFITQDPDSLRHAIDEAINSETFQTAIAANLARIIKPSIKSALDTIQPVVETVYSHELLLRKTNQSVENILERLDTVTEVADEDENGDPSTPITPRRRSRIISTGGGADFEPVKLLLAENNSQIDSKLLELSKSVETSNSKIGEVVDGIAGINASIWPTRETLDSLRSTSETSNTAISVMQAQLDQLNADVGTILDALGSDFSASIKALSNQGAGSKDMAPDTSLLSSHTTKLDTISSDILELKGQAGMVDVLNDISAKIESLKENVQSGITSSNENFASITPQLGNVLEAVQTHSSKLAEINIGESNAELLAAVKQSNESHTAHTLALGELKERNISSVSDAVPAPTSSSPETTAALQALAADLASMKENIVSGLATNNDSVSIVGTKVDDVLTTLEAHRAADQSMDILAAVHKSNDSHASHAEALEGIKSINVAPAASADSVAIPDIEPQLATIIATLDNHTAVLGELKPSGVSVAPPDPPSAASNLDGLESQITSIVGTLETHTAILNELKDDVSAEILTVLHDINEGHTGQNALLTEIREADMSEEILTALHASNDSHSNHTAVLADLHTAVKASNDSHASQAGVLDEIKASRSLDSGSVQAAPPAEVSDLGDLGAQIGTIITTLEDQNTTLSAIKDSTKASNESHIAHTLDLAEIKGATTASNESHSSHIATLDDLKTTLTASAESHANHTATLAEIKDLSSTSHDLHGSHTTDLTELKEALASTTAHHTSHASDLAELKSASLAANDLHASHITALSALSAAPAPAPPTTTSIPSNSAETPELQEHINTILTSLSKQEATLTAIQESTASPEVMESIMESYELLRSHTELLEMIRATQSSDDVVGRLEALRAAVEEAGSGVIEHGVSVNELHEMTRNTHGELKDAITALSIGGIAGAGAGALISSSEGDSSAEALEEIKAVRAIVEKTSSALENTPNESTAEVLEEMKAIRMTVEKSNGTIETVHEITTSTRDQIDINHTTVTTSITTLGDELKAEVDASGTEIASAVSGIDLTALQGVESEVKGLGVKIGELDGRIEVLDGSVRGVGENVVMLGDGVHLNEKGVGQLKEHAAVVLPTGKPELSSVKTVEEDAPTHETAAPEAETPIVEKQPEIEISPPPVEPEIEEPASIEEDPAAEEPVAIPETESTVVFDSPAVAEHEDHEAVPESEANKDPEEASPVDEPAPEIVEPVAEVSEAEVHEDVPATEDAAPTPEVDPTPEESIKEVEETTQPIEEEGEKLSEEATPEAEVEAEATPVAIAEETQPEHDIGAGDGELAQATPEPDENETPSKSEEGPTPEAQNPDELPSVEETVADGSEAHPAAEESETPAKEYAHEDSPLPSSTPVDPTNSPNIEASEPDRPGNPVAHELEDESTKIGAPALASVAEEPGKSPAVETSEPTHAEEAIPDAPLETTDESTPVERDDTPIPETPPHDESTHTPPTEDTPTPSIPLEDPTSPTTPSIAPEDSAQETESASTSAIASPLSPSFPGEEGVAGGKKKKGKKGKKGKNTFVFDPEPDEGEGVEKGA